MRPRKALGILCTSVLLCAATLIPGKVIHAEPDKVEINATNFCPQLRDLITAYDIDQNKDGYLDQEELSTVTDMSMGSNTSGSDKLYGIEYFTSVEKIICKNGSLKTLDLSNNKQLKELDCRDNSISSLDVSQCGQLTTLICSNNELNELNVSNNKNLEALDCSDNYLAELDVSENTALKRLDLRKNDKVYGSVYDPTGPLSELDVSNVTVLNDIVENYPVRYSANDTAEWEVGTSTWLRIDKKVTITTSGKGIVKNVILDRKFMKLSADSNDVNNSFTLNYDIAPYNAIDKNVTWSSSNPSVATVNSYGKVTALKKGEATITVTTQDGGKTDTCDVNVAVGKRYFIGDVNGDGSVTNADVMILSRYIKGWEGYAERIENMDAADINRDGEVKKGDDTLLSRAVKEWTSPENYREKYIKEVGGTDSELLKIVKEPQDVEMKDKTAVLSITVSGGFDQIIYEWQKWTSIGWRDTDTLSSDSVSYTTNNSALQVVAQDASEGVGQYRCIISAFDKGTPVDQVTSRYVMIDPEAQPLRGHFTINYSPDSNRYYFYHTAHDSGLESEDEDPIGGKIVDETNAYVIKNWTTNEEYEEAIKLRKVTPHYKDDGSILFFYEGLYDPLDESDKFGMQEDASELRKSMFMDKRCFYQDEKGDWYWHRAVVNSYPCAIESVSGGKGPYNYTWYLSKDRFGGSVDKELIEGVNCQGQGTERIYIWSDEPGKAMDNPKFMGFICCRVTDSKGRSTVINYHSYKFGSSRYHGYKMFYILDQNHYWWDSQYNYKNVWNFEFGDSDGKFW